MNKNLVGNPMPRPIKDLKDLVSGSSGSETSGGPMASDVETVINPKIILDRGKPPKRKRG